jgi:hypothetical protein
MHRFLLLATVLAALVPACGDSSSPGPDDGQADTTDAVEDSTPDDAAEVTPDAEPDTEPDTEPDAEPDIEPDMSEEADAEPEVTPDGGFCRTLRLVDLATTDVQLLDPAPLNVGRTLRIGVTGVRSCNQFRAMPEVEVNAESRTIVVDLHAWEEVGLDCAGADVLDTRWIPFLPPVAGTWHVQSPAGTERLALTVAAQPSTGCTLPAGGSCDEDCDCAEGVCLGGNGIGGPFTACATPCEENPDCSGSASCKSVDDGLDHFCDASIAECDAETSCPTGFACTDDACVPDYSLGSGTRVECTCDADCTSPLGCAEPKDADGTRRCEFPCPTGGAWCPGGHVCGPAAWDISGLAETDSVCGWIGD